MRTSKGSAGSGAPNEGFLDAPADNDVIEKLKHKLAQLDRPCFGKSTASRTPRAGASRPAS
ncbi:hypothetical protein MES4922_400018 [Mesorhizobium ventifaucium]|uniref:Transposase TnpC homeodomain domain-containing protein n=1 Tax=Mesorhizobium ventifaucium TaxID=666020 RepID=A0ABN8KB33_9HYPH|nr:hypothetical protein MES4922_400018 [Mesorhizobium ventifaucium]